jgi:5-methylcytosine-specific restriction endonuclease McrA
MTGRSVEEWRGKTPDSTPPASVRARVFLAHNGRCHISGRPIRPGDVWELEHVRPLSMGGENRETNLAPALSDAHREKTAAEAGVRAKCDRIRQKHLGIFPKSKRPLKSRGFQCTRQDR